MERRAFVNLLATAALSVGGVACASSGSTDGVRRGGPNRILRSELETVSQGSLWDAISRLRPRWLQNRGQGLPEVLLDGSRQGGVEFLRQLQINDVESAEFVNARDATTRWGTGYPAGAIMVTTRRPGTV